MPTDETPAKTWRCRFGLHQWSRVPRWWLKFIEDDFGPWWAEHAVKASMSPWPGGYYGGETCKPYCLRCGKGEGDG